MTENTSSKKKRQQTTEITDWQTVTKRRRTKGEKIPTINKSTQKTAKAIKAARDVALIKPNDGRTYVDVLGTLKIKINPKDTKTVVRTIWKTRDVGVLFVLGKRTEGRALFHETIREALG